MAGIIFSASAGQNDAKLGKLVAPLRTAIFHESDLNKKTDDIISALYNVEKSNHWAETYQYQDEFEDFQYSPEGARAENDSIVETRRKILESIQFSKTFSITEIMLEDANYGVSGKMAGKAEDFVRAYYQTKIKAATAALTQAVGNKKSITFNGAPIDLTCADGLALFNKNHLYGSKEGHGEGKQSNYFYNKRGADADISVGEVLEIIGEGANKLRNMKSENGEVLGYTADTIVLPGNAFKLENAVKQALGSQYDPATSNNAINTQFGNWNVIVLPHWQISDAAAKEYPIIMMSSEARRNLDGSVFLNRIPLSIKDWVDESNGNWNWRGRTRFGLGHPTYKHALLVKSVASGATVSDADLI